MATSRLVHRDGDEIGRIWDGLCSGAFHMRVSCSSHVDRRGNSRRTRRDTGRRGVGRGEGSDCDGGAVTGSRRNVPQRARGRRRGPWFGEDARVRRGRRRPFRARGCRRRCRGAARMCRRRPARPPGTDGHDNARSLGARRQIAGVADAGVFTMVERVFTMGWNRCSRWAGARSLDRGPARAQGRTRARRARPRHA